MTEKDIKTIVKILRNNFRVGEDYERGQVYVAIGDNDTSGNGDFKWDKNFWSGVELFLLRKTADRKLKPTKGAKK